MKYYTVTTINKLTGISIPTLLKYKKKEAVQGGRLHHYKVGEGKKMLFREDSLPVFRDLKAEAVRTRGGTR